MTEFLAFCTDVPKVTVPAGEVLIESGAVPAQMYVLTSGSVTIERDGVPFARIDTAGAVFGEKSVVLDRPATAPVRAASDIETM